jgi:hypothetical protein
MRALWHAAGASRIAIIRRLVLIRCWRRVIMDGVSEATTT